MFHGNENPFVLTAPAQGYVVYEHLDAAVQCGVGSIAIVATAWLCSARSTVTRKGASSTGNTAGEGKLGMHGGEGGAEPQQRRYPCS